MMEYLDDGIFLSSRDYMSEAYEALLRSYEELLNYHNSSNIGELRFFIVRDREDGRSVDIGDLL